MKSIFYNPGNLIIQNVSATLLLLSLLYVPKVWSGESGVVGGSGGRGGSSLTRDCPTTKRISGVQIKHENGGGFLITQIRARCTSYATSGGWANNQHSYTPWSNSSRPSIGFPPVVSRNAYCGPNQWVSAVEADTGSHLNNTVIKRIHLHCNRWTAEGSRTGNSVVVSAGIAGSRIGGPRQCPGNEIAFGLGIRSGWFLDNLRLRCKSESAISIPTTAPIPRLPLSTHDFVTAGIHRFNWSPVNGATHYRIRVLEDASPRRKWYDQILGGRLVNISGNYRNAAIRIPTNQAGKISRWRIQACNRNRQCGPWSPWVKFAVLPRQTSLVSPRNNDQLRSRRINFIWSPITQNAGYQLFIYKTNTPSSQRFNPARPSLNARTSYMLNQQVSNYTSTVNIPANLGNSLRWGVAACVTLPNSKIRKCTESENYGLTIR